jgi:hypothetical protein
MSGGSLATKTRSSFSKRQKEIARQTRMKEKLARRLDAKSKLGASETDPSGEDAIEDPDIAGIVLGPQPVIADDEDEVER